MNESTRNPPELLSAIETLVELLPAGVAIVDAHGSVVFANDEARRLLTGSEEISAFVARVLAGETVREHRILQEGARRFVVEVSGSPLHERNGDLIGAALLLYDASQREVGALAQRDFVTNAAHELQTPIAAITSAIEVLQRGAKERRGERDLFLGHIERAVQRLTRLTQALLVLARAQAGDELPRQELVSLEPMLQSIAEGLAGEGAIEVSCAPDLAVIANRPLLEQAIVNLGQNALKHASGRALLAAEREDGTVTIRVSDQGPGIDPAATDRVFERFYRGAEAGGFGLGLSIVREAVDALGGDLELESGPAGTRVSISLPGARLRR